MTDKPDHRSISANQEPQIDCQRIIQENQKIILTYQEIIQSNQAKIEVLLANQAEMLAKQMEIVKLLTS